MKREEIERHKNVANFATKVQLSNWQLLIMAGIILGLGFWLGQRNQSQQLSLAQPIVNQTQGNILPVETINIKSVQSYQTTQTYTGEIKSSRSSEVGFERGGKLITVLVEEGDRIEAGSPLAKLDTANLEAEKQALVARKAQAQAVLSELKNGARNEQITAAQASVRDWQQQLELEQLKSSRREYLYQEGAISQEQLDESTFNSKVLQERLANAKSNLAELNNGSRIEQITAQQAVVDGLTAEVENLTITIGKSVLKSPFAGIVASRHLDEGVVVETGQSILRLVEDVSPEVKVGIPTNLILQVQRGSKQEVQIDGKNYQAMVSSILPEIDSITRTRTVVLKLPSSVSNLVAPGQIARIKLNRDLTTDGYWLPINALVQGQKGLWSCFAIDPNSGDNLKVERRYLELLETLEDRVLVRGTLQPGDSIVVNGTHRLVPGQSVQLMRKDSI